MADAGMVKELIVQCENRPGLLAHVAQLLAERGINILAVHVEVREDEAVLHLVTSAHLHAREALRAAELTPGEREVVGVELPNRPGFLRKITDALARQQLDIHYLYATAAEGASKALVVFSCSHNSKAVLMLRER
ncbi:MAG: ACT domain-containing protein [Candidatus Bipolaricaulaceae bacterium]